MLLGFQFMQGFVCVFWGGVCKESKGGNKGGKRRGKGGSLIIPTFFLETTNMTV